MLDAADVGENGSHASLLRIRSIGGGVQRLDASQTDAGAFDEVGIELARLGRHVALAGDEDGWNGGIGQNALEQGSAMEQRLVEDA